MKTERELTLNDKSLYFGFKNTVLRFNTRLESEEFFTQRLILEIEFHECLKIKVF